MVLNDTLWSTVASKNNRRAATTLKENRLVTAVSKNDNQLSSRNLLGLGSNGHGKAEPEKEAILDNDSMLHDTCWFTVVSKKNRRAATTPEGNGPVTAVPKNDNQLRNQNLLGLGSNGFGKVGSKMDAILDNYLAKPVSDVSLKEAAEKLKQLLPPNWPKSPMAYKLSYKLFDHSLNSSYREKTHEKLAELLIHFERLTGRLTRVSKVGLRVTFQNPPLNSFSSFPVISINIGGRFGTQTNDANRKEKSIASKPSTPQWTRYTAVRKQIHIHFFI